MDALAIKAALTVLGIAHKDNVTHDVLRDLGYPVKPGESVMAWQVKTRAGDLLAKTITDLAQRVNELERRPVYSDGAPQ